MIEMIVTLGIVAVLSALVISGMDDMSAKKSYQNIHKNIYTELSDAKNEALARSTTTRFTMVDGGDGTYTVTLYASATPVATCSSSGTWSVIRTTPIEVHTFYDVTGTGMANTCFYRDGTASAGSIFSITPNQDDLGLKTVTITVTVATGFLDVVEN